MNSRRFPPPWTVEELDAGFVVRQHGVEDWPIQAHGGDRESSAASHQRFIRVCADPSAASTKCDSRCYLNPDGCWRAALGPAQSGPSSDPVRTLGSSSSKIDRVVALASEAIRYVDQKKRSEG
jgi:hypothetical protein